MAKASYDDVDVVPGYVAPAERVPVGAPRSPQPERDHSAAQLTSKPNKPKRASQGPKNAPQPTDLEEELRALRETVKPSEKFADTHQPKTFQVSAVTLARIEELNERKGLSRSRILDLGVALLYQELLGEDQAAPAPAPAQ